MDDDEAEAATIGSVTFDEGAATRVSDEGDREKSSLESSRERLVDGSISFLTGPSEGLDSRDQGQSSLEFSYRERLRDGSVSFLTTPSEGLDTVDMIADEDTRNTTTEMFLENDDEIPTEEEETQERNSYATTTITTNFTWSAMRTATQLNQDDDQAASSHDHASAAGAWDEPSALTFEEFENHSITSTVLSDALHREEQQEMDEEQHDDEDDAPTPVASTVASSESLNAAIYSSSSASNTLLVREINDSGKRMTLSRVVEEDDDEEEDEEGMGEDDAATRAERRSQRRLHFLVRLCVGICVCLLAFISILVGMFWALLFEQNQGSKSRTLEPPASPTIDPWLASVQNVILQAMAKIDAEQTTAASFQNSTSSASIVARWLAFDTNPDFLLTPLQIINRFVLGLLLVESVDLLDSLVYSAEPCGYEYSGGIFFHCGYSGVENAHVPTEIDFESIVVGGAIPPELALLSELRYVAFIDNGMIGTVPAILGQQLTKLTWLALDRNRLSGPIPPFPYLTNTLDLRANLFTSLPENGFPQLENLLASRNRLSGPLLGTTLGPNLTTLDLHSNFLQGTIPSDLCRTSPRMKKVDLAENEFSGTVPFEEVFHRCRLLFNLSLSRNNLTGPPLPLSAEGRRKRVLKRLDVANNHLTGPLASIKEFFPRLEDFAASHNLLTGPLSPQTPIRCLLLSGNLFTGQIPMSYFSGDGGVKKLGMASNLLTGRIPAVNVTILRTLDLSDNFLTGHLPQSLIPNLDVSNLHFVTFHAMR